MANVGKVLGILVGVQSSRLKVRIISQHKLNVIISKSLLNKYLWYSNWTLKFFSKTNSKLTSAAMRTINMKT